MRTYSSFLLFEEVLDFAPSVDVKLFQFIKDVTFPRVRVLSSDCQTKIGKELTVNYEIEGLIELATDATITKDRIDTILASGTYTVSVRSLFSCTQVGGICSRCFVGTYIDQTAPTVNTTIQLPPEYNYQTDVLSSNGVNKVFTLSETPDNYTKVLIIVDGAIQWTGYTIVDTTLTAAVAPILGKHIVVKFYKITAQPFVGFLSNTYSGALLGMKPLPTQALNIRPSLAQSLYTDEELNIMKLQLDNYPLIPSDTKEYIDNIHDKLEKAIYISMLYGIFSNANA